MQAVSIERVSKHFGSYAAVDGINLEVGKGEFVTLLGPSGCGKTTTLRMVAGLEQNNGGRISIGGELVSDAANGVFVQPERRRLGMVFQSYAIWPHMTVFDNVAYPLRIRRRSQQEIRERVGTALRLVEMEAFAQRPAPALSGGQQQRVAIARALVFEPEVLLLDEPLSNLDAKLRTQMGGEFRELQKRLGVTTLYVTHDQEEAMALSDRVVVMRNGHILQIGGPEEIYQRPVSREVAGFFGSPNLFDGTVTQISAGSAGEYHLKVDGPGFTGVARAAQSFAPGDKVTVMVRPESLRILRENDTPTPDHLSWTGTVANTTFHGSRRSVSVDTATRRLNVEAPAMRAWATGETVTLEAPPIGVWAFPASSEPALTKGEAA